MKIYRFIYKNKKVKIDDFECTEIPNCGLYCVEKYYNGYGNKLIHKEDLNIIKPNYKYIMWSLNKDDINSFIEQIIDYKNSTMTSLIRQIKSIKTEIGILENNKLG